MGNEVMDLEKLATYLHRDARELLKLASRGYIPGHRVGGQWRFHRIEINHWIETQMHAYTEEELTALESGGRPDAESELLLSAMLPEACASVPLPATTRSSVLRELVRAAEQSWNVYDPDAVLAAIRQREELASTALGSGVAIPHPHRPLSASVLGDHVLAFGRTASPIPFGADRGGLTDLFFLVCCRDDRTHLKTLARLSRLLLRPDFLDDLRAAESGPEAWEVIAAAERDLVAV
jgi:nitrogen PTS system EIIA component